MKAEDETSRVVNELVFTLKVRSGGGKRRLDVDIANYETVDLPFLKAIARVVALWYRRKEA